MLGILFSWLSPLRFIGIWIDTIAFSLIDDAYNLIVTFSSGTLLKQEFVENLMDNFYVIIGIFALFRIAMLLINSMINPEKLTEKGNGISNILVNFLVMFVLLIMTPVIFKEAINLQNVIVEGNYVQKIFINVDSLKGKNPGKAMRSIAIGSLITIDEEALEQYGETDENGKAISSSCSKNCNEAIEDYREMEKKGFSFSTIAKHIGVTIKNDDGETVYVYNYMFLVTFAVGCFIAYVLFSFAIDIAVRMVELTVLQILAPLFIATYIDPKSAKSGAFHNWLTTFGKTYASLFIKLAILALMLLLISIVGNLDYYASDLDLSSFEKLILLIAILIFAKKAPKWITEMIGIKSEGLGGLGIGKKLGGAALMGGAFGKGIEAGKKFAGQKGKNFAANRLRNTLARAGGMKEAYAHNRAQKKDLTKDGKLDRNAYKNSKMSLWERSRAAAKDSQSKNLGKDFKDMKDITSGYMAGRLSVNSQAVSMKDKIAENIKRKNAEFQDKVGNTESKRRLAQKIAKDNKTAQNLYADKPAIDARTGDRIKTADGKYINPQGAKEMNEAFGYPNTINDAYAAFAKNLAVTYPDEYKLSADGKSITTKSGKTMSITDFAEQKMSDSGRLAVASLVAENVEREVANYETSRTNLSNARQDYSASVIQYNQASERCNSDERVINAQSFLSEYNKKQEVVDKRVQAQNTINKITQNEEYKKLKDFVGPLTVNQAKYLEDCEKNIAVQQELIRNIQEDYIDAAGFIKLNKVKRDKTLKIISDVKQEYGLEQIEEQMKSSKQLITDWENEVKAQESKFENVNEFKFTKEGFIEKDASGNPITYNPYKEIKVNGKSLDVVKDYIKINEIKSELSIKTAKTKQNYENSLPKDAE